MKLQRSMVVSKGNVGEVDVVIVTAIRLEFDAVLQVDAGAAPGSTWEQQRSPSGLPLAFRSFSVANEKCLALRVAVACAADMGATALVNTLVPLVEWLRPRCVAMCGVCAGRRGKVQLGDVVAADRVYYHDTGKQRPEETQQDLATYKLRDDWKAELEAMDPVARFGDEVWFRSRPLTREWRELRALVALRDGVGGPWEAVEPALEPGAWKGVVEALRARGLVTPPGRTLTDAGQRLVDELLFKHQDTLPDLSAAGTLQPFRLHVAPIGSGMRVIEDERIWTFVSHAMRKTLGIEMEAAAVAEVAHRQRHHHLDWIVMKGVMDFADHGRDDHFKQFAARASAECLLWFLRERIPTDALQLPCPYPGMHPYSATNAEHFHGRDKEIEELLGRLRAGEREIYVIGPSGSGKSSLLAGGLLPRLARGAAGLGAFVVREMRPGEQPAQRLDQALEVPPEPQRVATDHVAAPRTDRGADSSLLIVVDQLEELFTLASASERELFLERLRALRSEPHYVVIFALRADFFGALMESPLWPDGGRHKLSRIEVGPLRGEALREVIAVPAWRSGVVVESELIERLIADAAAEPGILPLLQETLVQLWDKRVDRTLMLDDYEALRDGDRHGLAVALARRADTTLRQFNAAQTDIARRILLRLISFGEGRSDTRRQQPRSQLFAANDDAADFAFVLQTMVDDRLLTVDEDVASERRVDLAHQIEEGVASEPRVDLAHEVMITSWPTLASWLKTRREDEQQRRRLEVAAAQWVEHRRGVGGLLDAVMLAEAEAWRQTEAARELGETADVAEWVATSRAALANEVKTRRRQARWLAGVGLLLLAGIATTAIWVVLTQERELQRDVLRTNAYAAHAIAGGVVFRLREAVDATVAIAADLAVVQALHTFDVAALEQWRMTTRFDTVALYDRSGIARVQASPVTHRNRNLGKDYSWRDYFRGARRLGEAGLRAGYISRALLSETENIWVFGIAAPVYDEGTWAGVLLITAGTDAALGHRRLDRASNDGPMAVVVAPRDRSRATTEGENDYVVILHDGITHGAGIAMDSQQLRELRATRTERDQLRWIDPDPITDDAHRDPVPGFEGRWLAGFARVGDTGFVVIVQTRYDAALKPNTQLLRRLAWAGSAVILVWLTACATFLWRSVRRRRACARGTLD